jgi:hypothetical protein
MRRNNASSKCQFLALRLRYGSLTDHTQPYREHVYALQTDPTGIDCAPRLWRRACAGKRARGPESPVTASQVDGVFGSGSFERFLHATIPRT